MSGVTLDVRGLTCGHGSRTVVRDVSFTLTAGEFLCLLGPNGAGKTTLFKTLLRLLPAQGGIMCIDGENVAGWSRRRFAAMVGYVPQAHVPPFPFRVADAVVMGRTAHLGVLSAPSRRDTDMAMITLTSLGIGHLRDRTCTEISGGERQLVLLARALVQQPAILVLDEPTSNLDFGNQARVLDHVSRLAESAGLAIIMTTHDPNHALNRATKVATLDRAGTFSIGLPREKITPEYLKSTYGIIAQIAEARLDDGQPTRLCLVTG